MCGQPTQEVSPTSRRPLGIGRCSLLVRFKMLSTNWLRAFMPWEDKMPYKSRAQAAYFHLHPNKVGGMKVVREWDAATKAQGKPLPGHVKPAKGFAKRRTIASLKRRKRR